MKAIFRFISLMLALMLLAAVLSGCGEKKEETVSASEQETSENSAEEADESISEEPEEPEIQRVASEDSIVSVTMIKNDDGSVAAVAIEYDSNIEGESLSPSDYNIMSGDRSIEYVVTAIYTNDSPAMAEVSREGCYVIIELSENSADAMEEQEEEFIAPDGEEVMIVEGDESEGPDAEDTEEVTDSYGPDAEETEEETAYGPDGEPIDGTEIVYIASEPSEEIENADGDEAVIVVSQVDTVITVDGVEIGASPNEYTNDMVITSD